MVQFITATNVATAGLFEIEFVEPIGRNAIAQQVCLYSVAQVLALGSRGIDDTRRDTEIVAVNELIDVAQELMLVRPEVLGDVSRLYAIPICRLDLEDRDDSDRRRDARRPRGADRGTPPRSAPGRAWWSRGRAW